MVCSQLDLGASCSPVRRKASDPAGGASRRRAAPACARRRSLELGAFSVAARRPRQLRRRGSAHRVRHRDDEALVRAPGLRLRCARRGEPASRRVVGPRPDASPRSAKAAWPPGAPSMRRRWSSASTCRRCPMCPPQLQCGWSPAFAQRIGRWAVRRALQGSGALRWRSPAPPQTAHTPTRRPKRPAWRPGAPRALEPQVERCKPTGGGASDARRLGAGRLTACCTGRAGLFGGRPRPGSDAGA